MDAKVKSRQMWKCWKLLYCKLTGVNVNIPEENMKIELESHSESFKYCLSNYDSPVDYWDLKVQKDETISYEMQDFFLKMIKLLQIEPTDCMSVYSNFLLHDSHHTTALKELINEDMKSVLILVLRFFIREKLFHLRCLNYIITSSLNTRHLYYRTFEDFLLRFTYQGVYSSCVTRLNHIIRLPLPSYSSHGDIVEVVVPYWLDSNLQEQIHLLQIIILITPFIEFDFQNVQNHFELLRITLFGTMQHYGSDESHRYVNSQRMICYLVNFHALQLMQTGWRKDIYCKKAEKFQEHNILINGGDYRTEKGPLVVAWILLKCYKLTEESNLSMAEVTADYGYCNVDVWKFLLGIIESDLFQEHPELLKLAGNISNEMIHSCFKYFEMRIFHSPETLVSLVSAIAKWKGLPSAPKSVSVIWDFYAQVFPCNFEYFISITQSMMNSDTCTSVNNMIQKIASLKYSVVNAENISTTNFSNKYYLERQFKPLEHFPEVVFIAGTEVFFNYETNVMQFDSSVPLWIFISNYIKNHAEVMVSNLTREQNILNTQCIKFCCVVLKKSPHLINDMFTCVEDIMNLVHKISFDRIENLNLDIFSSCLDLSTVLLDILHEDILNFYSGLHILPDYDPIVKLDYSKFSACYYDGHSLWCLIESEERRLRTFTVLLSYLKFLRKLVSTKDTVESWYILGGLSLIYNVFVKLDGHIWSFEDPKDYNLIIWFCLDIIEKIITYGINFLFHADKSAKLDKFVAKNGAYIPTIYFLTEYCITSLITNDTQHIISSVATLGQSALFVKMENFISWHMGASAVLINSIRSSLSLLYRSLIYNDLLADRGVNVEKISSNVLEEIYKPGLILTYTSNCFHYALKGLAIKLLSRLTEENFEHGLNLPAPRLRKELLYPLTSSQTTDEFKVILLVLCSKCILKQKIIANALIDVEDTSRLIRLSRTTEGKQLSLSQITINKNNLFSFIVQHMINVQDEDVPELMNDMHCAVLKVLHAVWQSDLFHLRLYFTIYPSFWHSLCKPLLSKPKSSFLGYSLIIDIIRLELHKNDKLDSGLTEILQTFFNSDLFFNWTEFSIATVNVPDSLSLLFKSISMQKSHVSKSWKEFLLVISVRMKTFVQNPEKVAFLPLEELVKDVTSLSMNIRLLYLSDLYLIFLSSWKEKCSFDWMKELHLLCDLFLKLPEFSNYFPSFYSICDTLMLIIYKLFNYGKSKVAEVIMEREYVLDRLFQFFIGKLNHTRSLINDGKRGDSALLLYICFLADLMITLKGRMTDIIIYKMKYTGVLHNLVSFMSEVNNYENCSETANMGLQFFKMILRDCKKRKKLIDVDKVILDFACQIALPDFIISSLSEVTSGTSKKSYSILECKWLEMYKNVADIILLLLPDISVQVKGQMFQMLSRHFELWNHLFITAMKQPVNEKHLDLIICCITFLKYSVENGSFCRNDFPLIIEAATSMRSYMLLVIKLLLYPSKICYSLYGVETHTQLQEIFPDGIMENADVDRLKLIYHKLMLITRIAIATSMNFTVECELIYNSMWFGNPFQFSKYFSNTFSRQSLWLDPHLLPLLQLDDIILIGTYVDQSYSVVNQRIDLENKAVYNAIMRTTPGLLYSDTKTALVQCSMCFLSELSYILLHHGIHYKEKQILSTQIDLYMRDFLNGKCSTIYGVANIPLSPDIFKVALTWCSSFNPHICSKQFTVSDVASPFGYVIWNCHKTNDGHFYLSYYKEDNADSDSNMSDNLGNTSFKCNRSLLSIPNSDNIYNENLQPELEFEHLNKPDDGFKQRNDTLNDILLYVVSRFIFKLLLTHKYD